MRKQTLVTLAVLALLLVACGGLKQRYSEVIEESFAVGNTPALTVDNFAGDVTVRSSEGGTLRVVASKRAAREKDLDRIEVVITQRDGAVEVETDPPSGLKNVSVDIEITAPIGTHVDLHTGAGDVIVRDVDGDVRADSGAGDIDIRGTSGKIDAHTGAGSIDFRGRPRGNCRFDVVAGTIKLRLPADVNVKVDLDTSAGDIDVELPVDGKVSNRNVNGIIGSGDEGEIRAHVSAGNIDLVSQ